MLTSQRIAVDLSEQRTKIREFPQDGDVEELGRLEAAHKATEIRYRVEARSEGVEEDAVETAITDTETVEVRQLLDKFSIGDVFNAVANEQPTQGVERELQQHLGLGVHSIPFDALIEKRAALTTTGDEPSGSGDIIAQLFPDSISAFAGVRGESVPSGERTYPCDQHRCDGASTGEIDSGRRKHGGFDDLHIGTATDTGKRGIHHRGCGRFRSRLGCGVEGEPSRCARRRLR